MLYKFEPANITFQKVKIKSISSMMGGVMTVLDENRTDKEHFIKMKVPSTVALLYRKLYKFTKYLVPQEACIMMYNGVIVGVEKAIVNERLTVNLHNEEVEWTSNMERNYDKLTSFMMYQDWYFDGSFIYKFDCAIKDVVSKSSPLSSDDKYRAIPVKSYRMGLLCTVELPVESTRYCLVYSPISTVVAISPPIWGTLGGARSAKQDDDSDSAGLLSQFDKMEEMMGVNLNFALTAGTEFSRQFGYKSIDPLQLPKMMVQLKTVNLPNLPIGVKATYDIGMTFKQTVSWIMGKLYRSESFNDMLICRKVLKYLTSRGIFRRDSILKMRKSDKELPLYTREVALDIINNPVEPVVLTQSELKEAEDIAHQIMKNLGIM